MNDAPITTPRPPRLVTFVQAGQAVDRHERSIRNWLSEGLLTGYRVRGRRSVLVDLNQVEDVARRLRSRYGKARIVEVAARPIVVPDEAGR